MKNLLLVLLLVALPAVSLAESLFDGPVKPGYFVAPHLTVSSVNSSAAALLGVDVAFLANHQWILGLSGITTVSQLNFNYPAESDTVRRIEFGYAGLKVGVIGLPDYLVHWTGSLLIGGGRVSYPTPDDEEIYGRELPSYHDGFFVLEPEIGAELNITDNLRFNASAGYRWITWTDDVYEIGAGELSGPTLRFTFRFGRMSVEPRPKTGVKW